jgi:hypothetical protein
MSTVNIEKNENTRVKRTKSKEYIVKSVFLGERELKDIIWTIAEKKTIREMGLMN